MKEPKQTDPLRGLSGNTERIINMADATNGLLLALGQGLKGYNEQSNKNAEYELKKQYYQVLMDKAKGTKDKDVMKEWNEIKSKLDPVSAPATSPISVGNTRIDAANKILNLLKDEKGNWVLNIPKERTRGIAEAVNVMITNNPRAATQFAEGFIPNNWDGSVTSLQNYFSGGNSPLNTSANIKELAHITAIEKATSQQNIKNHVYETLASNEHLKPVAGDQWNSTIAYHAKGTPDEYEKFKQTISQTGEGPKVDLTPIEEEFRKIKLPPQPRPIGGFFQRMKEGAQGLIQSGQGAMQKGMGASPYSSPAVPKVPKAGGGSLLPAQRDLLKQQLRQKGP
jgi:hypothetical protein